MERNLEIVTNEDINRWLENGISEFPIMLHGTSIEALFELFNTGRLPTGLREIGPKNYIDATVDSLYFEPIVGNLVGTKLHHEIMQYLEGLFNDNFNLKDALFGSENYASRMAQHSYIMSKIGIATDKIKDYLIFITEARNEKWKGWQKENREGMEKLVTELAHYDLNIPRQRINRYLREAKTRKGVIIEPNENILLLQHEFNTGGEAVRVYCPNGLAKDIIRGIRLLGPVEIDAVQNYQAGRETGIIGYKSL